MKPRIASLLLIALLFAPLVRAQNGSTLVSRFGIGELNNGATVRQRGMGGVGTPLISAYDINMVNPASWTELSTVRLQASANFDQTASDLSGATATTRSAAITGLMFALPVSAEHGLTVALGFRPLSRTNFSLDSRGSEQGEGYRVDYQSRGGISLFQVGASWRPLAGLHLGASYNFNFGTISQNWSITFDNGTFYNTKQSRESSHNGSTATLGALYTGFKNLTFGASLTTGTDLRVTQDAAFSYITHDSSIIGSSGTISVPLQYGVGLSWVLSENLLAAAEYSAQNWSGVTVYNQPSSLFRNRSRLSAGVEIAPSRAVDESFFKRALYRLGVTRQSGYVAVQDQEVSEFFLTAGMGFQLGGFTRTDIAFEYGWRGQASNAMGKDTMMRLSIGVSASELWFVRRGDDE